MAEPLMSVIVPVYNTSAELLARSMGSILSQSLLEIEVVIVDDGSCPDVAYECERYAVSDGRVKVIHQSNGGVSKARNTGIDATGAPWLTFVDPDDELLPDALREGLELAVKERLDIVYATEVDVRDGDRRRRCMGFDPKTPLQVIEGRARIRELAEYFVSYEVPRGSGIPKALSTGPVARVFRREIVGDARFVTALTLLEDTIFNSTVVLRASRVGLLDRAWYLYYENPASATSTVCFGEWCEHHASVVRAYVRDAGLSNDAYYSWVCALYFFIERSLLSRNELTFATFMSAHSMPCFEEAFRALDLNKYEYQSRFTSLTYSLACDGRLRCLWVLYSLRKAKKHVSSLVLGLR